MDASKQALDSAQQAGQEETKSSAGDKYETSREMMQQETDRNRAQLNEANKLLIILSRINPDSRHDTADTGSLVITNNGKFYIAISTGTLIINGEAFVAVSSASPIGLLLKGRKAGDEFNFNGRHYRIEDIT